MEKLCVVKLTEQQCGLIDHCVLQTGWLHAVLNCIYSTHRVIKPITFNVMFVKETGNTFLSLSKCCYCCCSCRMEAHFSRFPLIGCQVASLAGLPANLYFLKDFMPDGQVYVFKRWCRWCCYHCCSSSAYFILIS